MDLTKQLSQFESNRDFFDSPFDSSHFFYSGVLRLTLGEPDFTTPDV